MRFIQRDRMRCVLAVLLLLFLPLTSFAKVITDKSGKFQYEVPDSFSAVKNSTTTQFVSPDKQIEVISSFSPHPKKRLKLAQNVKGFATAQDQAGKIYVRSGGIKLGGTEGMALELTDKQHRREINFITQGETGIAILVIRVGTNSPANLDVFAQLIARSFRWLIAKK